MKKNPEYWGRAGAGILFFNKYRKKVLLVCRSEHVVEPHTWSIPGGAVSLSIDDEHYFSSEEDYKQFAIDDIKNAAIKECKEELGSIPKELNFFDIVEYRDGNFTYNTFFASIDISMKSWKIRLNWENSDYGWFAVDNLPRPLHFGVEYLLQQRSHLF